MSDLSQYSYSILKRMYDNCKEKNESDLPLLIALMKANSNVRSQLLTDAAEDSTYIDSETRGELISGGYAVPKGNSTKMIITAKGIWEVMFRDEGFTTDDLIDGVQQLYFDQFSEKATISSSNRIALFAIISMRAFAESCCVDVKIKTISERWWDVFLAVNDFFLENGVILEKNSIRNQKKVKNDSEDLATNLIRHSDRVPRYTDEIFTKNKKLEYWADVLKDNGEIDIDRLALLIKLTLGDHINVDNYPIYSNFANDLCMDMGYMFESSFEESKYLSSSYDDVIRGAFEKASYMSLGN